MKIYLIKTNAGNEIVMTENDEVKVTDCAPTGMLGGKIDITSSNPDVVSDLKKYFNEISKDLNGFYEMNESIEDYTFSDLKKTIGEDDEIIFIYTDEI